MSDRLTIASVNSKVDNIASSVDKLAALMGQFLTGGQPATPPAPLTAADLGQATPIVGKQLANGKMTILPADKPQSRQLAFSDLPYAADNSKREVSVTSSRKNNATGETEEETRNAKRYLRDETIAAVYPLLQQQAPLIQLRVIVNGKETNHYLNLNCGKSASGTIQYSAQGASIPVTIVDENGQHGVLELKPYSSLLMAGQQFTAYGSTEANQKQSQHGRVSEQQMRRFSEENAK